VTFVPFVCCLSLAAFAQSQSKPRTQPASAEQQNAAAGKRLYERTGCYECHGHEGQGGAAGKRLAPHPIAYADFAAYCRHPTAEMPPYSAKILSDADLAGIYSYLQSLPDPPAAKSIPILNEPAKKSEK
jgi:ubiquinol-cytochrome c reductase cytochrome c subunit